MFSQRTVWVEERDKRGEQNFIFLLSRWKSTFPIFRQRKYFEVNQVVEVSTGAGTGVKRRVSLGEDGSKGILGPNTSRNERQGEL